MTDRASGRLTMVAGILLLLFAALVAANTAVALARGSATGADVSFVALLIVITAVSGRGLHLGAPWAWWISLAVAVAGLFFLLPVIGTMLFGGYSEPIGTGWDVAFFPVSAADLFGLVVVLWLVRKRGYLGHQSTGKAS